VQLFRNQALKLGASFRTIRKGVKVKHNLYKLAIGVVLIMCCVVLAQALEDTGKTVPPAKAEPAKTEKAPAMKDVADTVAATANLKKLADALKAADLVTVLKGAGPFTIFAPTDEAFGKLAAGTLEGWMKPENKAKLAGILKYHVVNAKVDLAKEKTLKSVQGQALTVVVEKDVVTIDGAKVTGKEIVCGNGVIHLIDKVVEPKAAPAAEKPAVEKPVVETPDTE